MCLGMMCVSVDAKWALSLSSRCDRARIKQGDAVVACDGRGGDDVEQATHCHCHPSCVLFAPVLPLLSCLNGDLIEWSGLCSLLHGLVEVRLLVPLPMEHARIDDGQTAQTELTSTKGRIWW